MRRHLKIFMPSSSHRAVSIIFFMEGGGGVRKRIFQGSKREDQYYFQKVRGVLLFHREMGDQNYFL